MYLFLIIFHNTFWQVCGFTWPGYDSLKVLYMVRLENGIIHYAWHICIFYWTQTKVLWCKAKKPLSHCELCVQQASKTQRLALQLQRQKSDTEIWVGEWQRQREDVFIFFSVPVQWGKSYKLSKGDLHLHNRLRSGLKTCKKVPQMSASKFAFARMFRVAKLRVWCEVSECNYNVFIEE